MDSAERVRLEARRAQLIIDAEAQADRIERHIERLDAAVRELERIRAELEGAR